MSYSFTTPVPEKERRKIVQFWLLLYNDVSNFQPCDCNVNVDKDYDYYIILCRLNALPRPLRDSNVKVSRVPPLSFIIAHLGLQSR